MRAGLRPGAPLRAAVALTVAAGLAGCMAASPVAERLSTYRRVASEQPNVMRSEVDFTIGDGAARRREIAARGSVTVQEIRSALSDTTQVSFSGAHGTQAEYAGRDGRTYLWYPGNRLVLTGRWKAEPLFIEYAEDGKLIKRFENSKICFSYGADTYNPATGHAGGGWECQTFHDYGKRIGELRRGDLLHLRGRADVPFILTKDKQSLDELRARLGLANR